MKWYSRLFSLGMAVTLVVGSALLTGYQIEHRVPTTRREILNRHAAVMPLEEFLKLADVELNSADQKQLEELPGVGVVLAQRIVEYRRQNGDFTSVDQLLEIKGIGPIVLERIRRAAYIE